VSDHRFEPPVLHIHAQRFPHDTVEVFGSTRGLEQLINALIEAVNSGRGRGEFMVSDGTEGELRVVCLDGVRRPEEWKRSGSPYLFVEDPLVARIILLSEEVERLKQTVRQMAAERSPSLNAE
jgi:hypothetical protein